MVDTLQNFAPPLGTWEIDEAPPKSKTEKAKKPTEPDPARDLLIYFLDRFQEVHGFAYKPMWVKDVNLVRKYIERFRAEAQPLLEWFFQDLRGKWHGEVQTPSLFSAGSAWVLDQIYVSWKSHGLTNGPAETAPARMRSASALTDLAE